MQFYYYYIMRTTTYFIFFICLNINVLFYIFEYILLLMYFLLHLQKNNLYGFKDLFYYE
jgi:hypothetical protein